MSQAKLTNILPLIREAAKVVIEKELKENVEYETFEISGEYSLVYTVQIISGSLALIK